MNDLFEPLENSLIWEVHEAFPVRRICKVRLAMGSTLRKYAGDYRPLLSGASYYLNTGPDE